MAYRCQKCNETFLRKTMLDRHDCSKPITKESCHKCEACGILFITKEVLRNHKCRNRNKVVDTGTKPSLVTCQYCKAQFTNPNTLKIHERVHTGDLPYKCRVCGEKFPYHSNLRSHERIHESDTTDRPHKCNQCGAKFASLSNLQAHERTHTTDETKTCDKCKGLMPDNCKHVCPKDGEGPFFVCVECDAQFTVKHTLDVHMRTHTGERPYKCTQCGERFCQPGALQSHIRTHATRLDHECGECGLRFANEERLNDHVRSHAQITIHKCSICHAAFANASRLLAHMEQKHIQVDKSFKCSSCSESFSSDAELQSHIRNAHSDANTAKFKCTKCSSAFTTFVLLQNHIGDAHPSSAPDFPNANFRCEECGSKYTTQNRLIAHRRVKHPEKALSHKSEDDSVSATSSHNANEDDNSGKRGTSSLKDQSSVSQNEGSTPKISPAKTNPKRKIQDPEDGIRSSLRSTKKKIKLTCKKCNESFDTQYQLHIHEQGHEYEKACSKCGNIRCTCSNSSTAESIKRGRKLGVYKCDGCKGQFIGRQQFTDHECNVDSSVSSEHSSIPQSTSRARNRTTKEVTPTSVLDTKMQKCPECNIKFTRKQLVDLHLLTVHKLSYRNCGVCNEPFTHPVQMDAPNDKLYTCAECSSSEPSKSKITPQKSISNAGGSANNKNDVMDSIVEDMIENDEGINDENDMLGIRDDDDDVDDTKGVPFVEVKTERGHSLLEPIKTVKCEPTCSVKKEPVECDDSPLSKLVPKLIQILALTVEGTDLEDFGWPNASSAELIERVVRHFGGMPVKNVGTDEETLAANCKELFILCIGSEGTKKLLEGQTIQGVIEEVIANEEQKKPT